MAVSGKATTQAATTGKNTATQVQVIHDTKTVFRNIPATCAHCHADAERMARSHLTERNPVASYNHTFTARPSLKEI